MCFAPKDNPKIAIACIVENAGFGGTWAAPVAVLMVEKYLLLKKDSTTSRPDLEKRLLNAYFLSKPKPIDTLRLKFIKDSTKKAKRDSIEKARNRQNNNGKAAERSFNNEMVLNEREEDN